MTKGHWRAKVTWSLNSQQKNDVMYLELSLKCKDRAYVCIFVECEQRYSTRLVFAAHKWLCASGVGTGFHQDLEVGRYQMFRDQICYLEEIGKERWILEWRIVGKWIPHIYSRKQ